MSSWKAFRGSTESRSVVFQQPKQGYYMEMKLDIIHFLLILEVYCCCRAVLHEILDLREYIIVYTL